MRRLYGDLKIRPKLMVLHNLFFLVLALAVYAAVIPIFEQQVHHAEAMGLRPDIDLIARARLNLFIVLGAVYIAAVLLLELVIMPLYVYRPIRAMLQADEASRHDNRSSELIPAADIPGDEIGQIMTSRNDTVTELRRQEARLEEALRKLTETAEDLRRKNELLESQDRLVSLGLLSASVAHELNTPLAVLQGSIEKLHETSHDAHARERLARALRVTQRIRQISEGLLDFARTRKQATERVLVRPLVEEAWSLVGIDDKAGRLSFTDAVAEDAAVIGNPDRLVQVFVNLLRNAVNAAPADAGRIGVRSRISGRGGRTAVTIAVEDNGSGIPADVLPEIFEAFVSTRLDARGTGLGLTVAQGIVHQHGGSITASNRAEGGACLEITLPAA